MKIGIVADLNDMNLDVWLSTYALQEALKEMEHISVVIHHSFINSEDGEKLGPKELAYEFYNVVEGSSQLSNDAGYYNLFDIYLVASERMWQKVKDNTIKEYYPIHYLRDSILLMQQKNYHPLAKKKSINEDYLLCYYETPSKEKLEFLKFLLDKKSLKLVSNQMGNNELKSLQSYTDQDIREFLLYLRHAKVVITDSGFIASMALLYEKPFLLLSEKTQEVLAAGILKELGLSSLILSDLSTSRDISIYNSLLETYENNQREFRKRIKDFRKEQKKKLSQLIRLASYEMYVDCPTDIKKIECCGCTACREVCPYNAIEMKPDEEGFIYPVVDHDKCVKCMLCKKVCVKRENPQTITYEKRENQQTNNNVKKENPQTDTSVRKESSQTNTSARKESSQTNTSVRKENSQTNTYAKKENFQTFTNEKKENPQTITYAKKENSQAISHAESYPIVYAVNNKKLKVRTNSSSGGIFPELVQYVIEELEGYVVGVKFDNDMNAVSSIAHTMEEAKEFYGAKYTKSDFTGMFRNVKKLLDKGETVLYSALPCEAAGLRAFLRKRYDNLIVSEVLCHAGPSPLVFRRYVQYLESRFHSKVKKINFRDKSKGWLALDNTMVVEFANREPLKLRARRNNYYRSFIKDNIARPACSQCSFVYTNRVGDLTMGDFWGIQYAKPEMFDNKGTSILMINTKNGENIWNKISNRFEYEESNLTEAFRYNHKKPIKLTEKRNEFFDRFEKEEINSLLQEFNDLK
ncbi:Coenzyme F420 hydrogenase/dehydrogenase, beta subunit C-terminal domain [Lachnoclostridium phytofermentans]|uniref:4Fe-4S ferredoxin iron-sulfur binding domain protein n=1 Tax=Lachnoclostridium phytofermentans (strain ATCC 700394 / DSM 18823 / ISDg) TaxID=357809 RepID=A9KI99_LACP7|nr:Coenzyme F420 hydrogenase/dehydrogenase, beta subunit C-terminal domain [Lachnoclostridium phytofermentans]ABX40933.1 4Fe-4S ferredoxin iron-sulfur binding domain protein [Lachnoclostridium phytofermentans ISDg]